MALGPEVVDLVGLHLLDDPDQVGAVGEVPVMKHEARVTLMRVLVEVVDPCGVEATRAALYAMHQIPLFEQQFRQIATVLAGDASDEGSFVSPL